MQDDLKNFDYISHYRIDAKEFDYFEERTGATLHEERRVREAIIDLIPDNTKVILDVGCGSGWVANTFLRKNIRVISLDISVTNPKKVRELYPSSIHNPLVADSFHLPLKSNSVDCVIASEIIEHVIKPSDFVNELLRVVKEGGRLVLSTPYKEKIKYYLCIHCNKKTPANGHLHSFDEKKLESLYNQSNLVKFSYNTFGNKALIFLRTHIFLKYLPFKIWQAIDWLANKIYKKPLHIVCVYEKKN